MQGRAKIDAARRAAHYVLSWLQPGSTEAAVFTFDSRLQEVQGFTNDLGRLRDALKTSSRSASRRYTDAIAETARRVDVRTNKRRGILVLTDGVDTNSRLTPEEVSGIASSIDMPVYLFAVVSPLDHPGGPDSIGGATAAMLSGALSDLARGRRRLVRHEQSVACEPCRRPVAVGTAPSVPHRVRASPGGGLASSRNTHPQFGALRSHSRRVPRRPERAAVDRSPARARVSQSSHRRIHMKKMLFAAPIVALAVGLSTGCATKKYVNTRTGEVNTKVETLSKSVEENQERTRRTRAAW